MRVNERLHASTLWFPIYGREHHTTHTGPPSIEGGTRAGCGIIEYLRIRDTYDLTHHHREMGWGSKDVSVVIARGKRPVTFRTRKLRLSAPMVLQGGPCGRVGHRRTYFSNTTEWPPLRRWPFCVNRTMLQTATLQQSSICPDFGWGFLCLSPEHPEHHRNRAAQHCRH